MNSQQSDQQFTYQCPNDDCGASFDEPVEERNKHGIESLHCPFCDVEMSKRLAEQANVEECVHNATVDGLDGETCSECGVKWGRGGKKIGIKLAWNAAGGRL